MKVEKSVKIHNNVSIYLYEKDKHFKFKSEFIGTNEEKNKSDAKQWMKEYSKFKKLDFYKIYKTYHTHQLNKSKIDFYDVDKSEFFEITTIPYTHIINKQYTQKDQTKAFEIQNKDEKTQIENELKYLMELEKYKQLYNWDKTQTVNLGWIAPVLASILSKLDKYGKENLYKTNKKLNLIIAKLEKFFVYPTSRKLFEKYKKPIEFKFVIYEDTIEKMNYFIDAPYIERVTHKKLGDCIIDEILRIFNSITIIHAFHHPTIKNKEIVVIIDFHK